MVAGRLLLNDKHITASAFDVGLLTRASQALFSATAVNALINR